MAAFVADKRNLAKATATCLPLASFAGQQQAHQILTHTWRLLSQTKEALYGLL